MPNKFHFTIFVIQNTHEFQLCCWDHVCKVNEWCLVDCFHREFKVSTHIMVCHFWIMKYKTFFFTIQHVYANSNPGVRENQSKKKEPFLKVALSGKFSGNASL